MRSKSFLILGLVTLLAVLAAAASAYWRATSHALPPTPAALFPGLIERVNEVAAIEVASSAAKFSVVRGEGENWSMPEKSGYPVTYETVKQTVLGLANMRPLEAKTRQADRHGKIKVMDPRQAAGTDFEKGVLVRLAAKDGKEVAALIVGKTRSIQTGEREGWFYVRKPEEPQSWLVATRLEVADSAKGWLDIDVPRLERKRLRAVKSTRPEGEPVSVSRPRSDKTDFTVDNLPQGMSMIHETAANGFASALGFITFDDVAKADAIDFSKAVTAEYRTYDGLAITVKVAKLGEKSWAHFSAAFDAAGTRLDEVAEADKDKLRGEAEVKQEAEALNRRFGPWAYNLPAFKAEDFTTPMSKLVAPVKPNAS